MMRALRESSHERRMRREVQDSTALRTIVLSFEARERARTAGEEPDPFAVELLDTLGRGWMEGTLTDRIRLPASDALVPRAERVGFSWGRGERFRNRSHRHTTTLRSEA